MPWLPSFPRKEASFLSIPCKADVKQAGETLSEINPKKKSQLDPNVRFTFAQYRVVQMAQKLKATIENLKVILTGQ